MNEDHWINFNDNDYLHDDFIGKSGLDDLPNIHDHASGDDENTLYGAYFEHGNVVPC